MSIEVSIIGASGYTGVELFRLLENHPDAEILGAYGKTTAGKKISDIHPSLKGITELTIEKPDYKKIGKESDLVFTATPHGVAMKFVPEILEEGARVIDISADYRLKNVQVYEDYYNTTHQSPHLKSVYGLSEIYRNEIEDAELIANPGCYPTAALLSLAPLLKRKLVNLDHIIIDSKSGTSGAGIKPNETLHHPTCTENIRAYSVTGHRHSPEIQQEAENLAGKKTKTHFTPHLIPITRGILSTAHVFMKSKKDETELIEIYEEFYKESPFVRVLKVLPQTNAVKGSNFCDIGIRTSKKTNRAIIVSAIDNLVKGASGQAIQNMNINFGLDEKKGLEGIPLRP